VFKASRDSIDLKMASLLRSKKGATDFDEPELDVKYGDFCTILNSVELDLKEFVSGMSYNGFNKQEYSVLFARKIGAKRLVKILVLGAMRGTNLKKIISKSVKVDSDIEEMYNKGLVKSNGKDYGDLTVGRALACYPEVACHYLQKHGVAKKIPSHSCPASLQFPAAAGIPMDPEMRAQHISFSVEFSKLIGSTPAFQYYAAAFNGQCSTDSLSKTVKDVVGDPQDDESRAVNISAMWNELAGNTSEGGVEITRKVRGS